MTSASRTRSVVPLLAQLPLFGGLPEADLITLSRSAHPRPFQQGAILFLEGETGDVAYVVVSGRIDLVLESMEGTQLILQQVGPRGYFGEMALLDEGPRSATAVAASGGEVVVISREAFLQHLQQHPETMLHLLRSLSLRVRWADEKIKILGFLDAAGRLARTLLDLEPSGKVRATIPIRHEQLAGMVRASRQTVSTILGEWRRAGYLATGRGSIMIVDREALEDLAVM